MTWDAQQPQREWPDVPPPPAKELHTRLDGELPAGIAADLLHRDATFGPPIDRRVDPRPDTAGDSPIDVTLNGVAHTLVNRVAGTGYMHWELTASDPDKVLALPLSDGDYIDLRAQLYAQAKRAAAGDLEKGAVRDLSTPPEDKYFHIIDQLRPGGEGAPVAAGARRPWESVDDYAVRVCRSMPDVLKTRVAEGADAETAPYQDRLIELELPQQTENGWDIRTVIVGHGGGEAGKPGWYGVIRPRAEDGEPLAKSTADFVWESWPQVVGAALAAVTGRETELAALPQPDPAKLAEIETVAVPAPPDTAAEEPDDPDREPGPLDGHAADAAIHGTIVPPSEYLLPKDGQFERLFNINTGDSRLTQVITDRLRLGELVVVFADRVGSDDNETVPGEPFLYARQDGPIAILRNPAGAGTSGVAGAQWQPTVASDYVVLPASQDEQWI